MFQEALNNYENIVLITIDYLKRLKVNVTSVTVDEELGNHPDYPSLLSIQDSLMKWGLDVVAIKTSEDKFNEIPIPYITVLNGEFILVTDLQGDDVFYTNGTKKDEKMTKEEFLKGWNSIIMLADGAGAQGEKDFKKKQASLRFKKLKYPFLVLLGLLGVGYGSYHFYINQDQGQLFFLYVCSLFIALLGIVISTLLLWYEIDKANPILQKFCSGTGPGSKTNCSAILNSKQAKLFSWLSWSEVGFFYYVGVFLSLLFAGNISKEVLILLVTLNFFTIVYPFFSIYYQWKVAKQWCVFCLSVQILLVVQFILGLIFTNAYSYELYTSNFDLSPIYYTFIPAFLFPIVFWYLFKPTFIKLQQVIRDKKELVRIKFDPQVFNGLKEKGKKVTVSAEGMGVFLGNPNGTHTLIKVCNPYCGPCANAHPEIEKLIAQVKELKVQVIFTATADEEDKKGKPVRHLLAIQDRGDHHKTVEAIDDWYLATKKDYDEFAKRWPVSKEELDKQTPKLQAMSEWSKQVEIQYTPTIFIDGEELPKSYNIKDLPYFILD